MERIPVRGLEVGAGERTDDDAAVGHLAPLFADFAGVREGDRVLDVGAGTGALTRELAERGATVVAVEPSPEFTRALRSRFPQIEVHEASAEALPFPDDSFDVASSNSRRRKVARRSRAKTTRCPCRWASPSVARTAAVSSLGTLSSSTMAGRARVRVADEVPSSHT